MKTKANRVELGLFLGLLMPVLTFFVFYLFLHDESGIVEFINEVIVRQISTQVISLCAVPNLLLFFIFIWADRLYSARGVLTATFIIAFAVLILKFVI
ncbi:MAG TPA: hypothetical protein ENF21_06470 [Bacteroidetes bacterium]|nr:hypothetical protein [Bacteroidota bacterium]